MPFCQVMTLLTWCLKTPSEFFCVTEMSYWGYKRAVHPLHGRSLKFLLLCALIILEFAFDNIGQRLKMSLVRFTRCTVGRLVISCEIRWPV